MRILDPNSVLHGYATLEISGRKACCCSGANLVSEEMRSHVIRRVGTNLAINKLST